MKDEVQLITAFEDSVRRRSTPEQLQWFIDRARRYWSGNAEMLGAVERIQDEMGKTQ